MSFSSLNYQSEFKKGLVALKLGHEYLSNFSLKLLLELSENDADDLVLKNIEAIGYSLYSITEAVKEIIQFNNAILEREGAEPLKIKEEAL